MLTQLQPLLIASPVRRSGITLLQRLLCPAPNSFVFGEGCANGLWRQFTDYARQQLRGEHVLHLDFETLMDWPAPTIELLENFPGAKGIQTSVLQEKINSYRGDRRLAEDGQPFLLPVRLNEDELALIAAISLRKMQDNQTFFAIHQ